MNTYYSDDMVTLHHGDARTVAGSLDADSVQTIVTSPPYYGLRDYGHPDQIGAEDSVEDYVESLVAVFAAVRFALRLDGTLWLNLGDSYANDTKWGGATSGKHANALHGGTEIGRRRQNTGLPSKSMMGIPWRVAFALQADGWVLRSETIWAKPNPMPESVTDRPTKSHEHIFLLSKVPQYYYDAEAIREPDAGQDHPRSVLDGQASLEPSGGLYPAHAGLRTAAGRNGDGRNKRDVWTVPAAPFPGAHFAVYPPALIRPCVLAGSRAGDTVLDPFSGSGTTGMVALDNGRRYIGIDTNAEYLDLSLRTRFAQPSLGVEVGL